MKIIFYINLYTALEVEIFVNFVFCFCLFIIIKVLNLLLPVLCFYVHKNVYTIYL